MSLIIAENGNSISIQAGSPSVDVSGFDNAVSVSETSGAISVSDFQSSITVQQESTTVLVANGEINLEVAVVGIQGAIGPQGPQGVPGGPVARIDDLYDVTINAVQSDNLIKYSGTAEQWVNTSILDGGNY
jgi:hypothetical protein